MIHDETCRAFKLQNSPTPKGVEVPIIAVLKDSVVNAVVENEFLQDVETNEILCRNVE